MKRDETLPPRIGVPFRNGREETAEERGKYDTYLQAVQRAGGEPVEISLFLPPATLRELAVSLDGVVLPGSPRDVNPALYGVTVRHPETTDGDAQREQTDMALLDDAFRDGKPVLAICYGVQLLNVYLGGTLIQHLKTGIEHSWPKGAEEPLHTIRLVAGTEIEKLADGAAEVIVNSSHHQSIAELGRGLQPVALAADGVIEAVELAGGVGWVFGAQWHPERMTGEALGDRLSQALFVKLIAAARAVREHAVEVR